MNCYLMQGQDAIQEVWDLIECQGHLLVEEHYFESEMSNCMPYLILPELYMT